MWIKCKHRHKCKNCKHNLFIAETGKCVCTLKMRNKEKIVRILLRPVIEKHQEKAKQEKERIYENIMKAVSCNMKTPN